jgi:hypothetical protein
LASSTTSLHCTLFLNFSFHCNVLRRTSQ